MFALVPEVPGAVTEVTDIRPKPFTNWYDSTASVQVGWNFDGSTFTPPPAAEPTPPTAEQILQYQAQIALANSDITITRCLSAQPPVAIPAAWTTYRADLRAIVNGSDTTSTTLPATPAYPAGT